MLPNNSARSHLIWLKNLVGVYTNKSAQTSHVWHLGRDEATEGDLAGRIWHWTGTLGGAESLIRRPREKPLRLG